MILLTPPLPQSNALAPFAAVAPSGSVDAVIEQFLFDRDNNRGCNTHTVEWYRKELALFANWLKENQVSTIDQVKLVHIQAYIAYLRKRPHLQLGPTGKPLRDGNLSPVTVRKRAKGLRTFFKWVYAEGLTLRDVSNGLTFPKSGQRLPKAPTLDQVAQLLSSKMHPRDRAAICLMFDAGLRLSEVCGLDLDDVDLIQGTVFVRHGKGDKERYAIFETETAQILAAWLKARHADLGEKALFVNLNNGQRIDASDLYKAVKRVARRAGLGDAISPHRLRHGFVSAYLNAGGKITDAQLLAGHTDIKTTMGYLHIALNRVRESHAQFSPMNQIKHLINPSVKEVEAISPSVKPTKEDVKGIDVAGQTLFERVYTERAIQLPPDVHIPKRFIDTQRQRRWFAEGFDDARSARPPVDATALAELQSPAVHAAYMAGRRAGARWTIDQTLMQCASELASRVRNERSIQLPPDVRIPELYNQSHRARRWFGEGFDDELKSQPTIDGNELAALESPKALDAYLAGRKAATRWALDQSLRQQNSELAERIQSERVIQLPPDVRVAGPYNQSHRGRRWFAEGFDDEINSRPSIDGKELAELQSTFALDAYSAGRQKAAEWMLAQSNKGEVTP
ncbi:MAG: tyrosine-type recombinase/integrase [Anaerolineae bacterium]